MCSEVRFRQRKHVGRLISFFSFCSDSERHIYDFFFFFFWYSYDSRHLKRIRGELIRRYVGLFRIQPIFSSDWKQLPARCSRPPSTATVPFEAPKRKIAVHFYMTFNTNPLPSKQLMHIHRCCGVFSFFPSLQQGAQSSGLSNYTSLVLNS